MDCTTLSDVRLGLSFAVADTTRDTLLSAMITAISARAENYMDRGVQSTARVEYFDVTRPTMLRLYVSSWPVAASPAPAVVNDATRAWTQTALDVASYTYDPTSGLFTFDKCTLIDGPRYLQVSYTGGLAADVATLKTSYPDLEWAVRTQVIHEFRRRDTMATTSRQLGEGSIAFDGPVEWLPTVLNVLDDYKAVRRDPPRWTSAWGDP